MGFILSQVFLNKKQVQTIFGLASTSVVNIGEIVLPTGKIVAYDPLDIELPPSFFLEVKPGIYPVSLSIGKYSQDNKFIALGAKIFLNHKLPTKWELAVSSHIAVNNTLDSYYSSSVIGCFLDESVVEPLMSFVEQWSLGVAEITTEEPNIIEKMLLDMNETNKVKYPGVGWSTVTLDLATKANLICFSSGNADGNYKSYFGYSDDGEIVELITDFNVIGEKLPELKDFPQRRLLLP